MNKSRTSHEQCKNKGWTSQDYYSGWLGGRVGGCRVKVPLSSGNKAISAQLTLAGWLWLSLANIQPETIHIFDQVHDSPGKKLERCKMQNIPLNFICLTCSHSWLVNINCSLFICWFWLFLLNYSSELLYIIYHVKYILYCISYILYMCCVSYIVYHMLYIINHIKHIIYHLQYNISYIRINCTHISYIIFNIPYIVLGVSKKWYIIFRVFFKNVLSGIEKL